MDKITTALIAGVGVFAGELALGGIVPVPVGMLGLAIVGIILHGLLRQQP
jgi:hypothetical protein